MTLDETFKAAKAGDLTNDTTYKVGEISRKTGLQKQPDGSWAPPKTGARQPEENQETAGSAEMQLSGKTKKPDSEHRTDRQIAREAGYSVYRDGESRNGYYREYRNGDDIIRYDQNGYDDRAEGKKYSAMESGPGGKRRFFNSLQEAADWIKKGSPRNAAPAASSQDAAYTAESVNAPRENLERKLTGDCKIRIRK